MTEVAIQSFEHVGRELNLTLAEARTALESYVEQPENVSLLNRTAAELHQVQGVLKVLEIYGAALLAEEMEQVARYLVASAGEQKNQAESLDALMRAMVQLPSYLERVLAGGRDLALILLPLLNDLRAVRGCALLSEGTLLLLNLKSDRQAQPVAGDAGEAPLTIEQWAPAAAAAIPAGSGGLDPRRAARTEPRHAGRGGPQTRAGGHPPAGVPAVVGDQRRHRGTPGAWPFGRRVHQAPAGARRPRDQAAL